VSVLASGSARSLPPCECEAMYLLPTNIVRLQVSLGGLELEPEVELPEPRTWKIEIKEMASSHLGF
jgi:hypothetical protein